MNNIQLSQKKEHCRSIRTHGKISEGSKLFCLPNLLQVLADEKSHNFKHTEKDF